MKDAKKITQDKKVVVLGAMKSAWDALSISYPHAKSLTLISKKNELQTTECRNNEC